MLAQIGYPVPADAADVPIRDRLLSRIGTGDDMENNLSTFKLEMHESVALLRYATRRSLCLVDELGPWTCAVFHTPAQWAAPYLQWAAGEKMCHFPPGRSTASRDGQALAWAIAEQLVDRGALTLFVTHYAKLTQLGALYPSECVAPSDDVVLCAAWRSSASLTRGSARSTRGHE